MTDTETLTAALAAAPQLLEAAACKQPHHVQALPAQKAMLLALKLCPHRLQEPTVHHGHGSDSAFHGREEGTEAAAEAPLPAAVAAAAADADPDELAAAAADAATCMQLHLWWHGVIRPLCLSCCNAYHVS